MIDGVQVAGICDDDGELIFGMVQQHPSNRNEKRNEKGEIIRPAANIFRPFGKHSLRWATITARGRVCMFVGSY